MLASQKQESIREAFKDWVFVDQERRDALCKKYNVLFNSTRPREYVGEHLKFPGMTPDIELKEHQKNAVAHVLYGDNTLLAHCVGAGKTFEMTAAAMESKRLGLCQKSLFVVPNHLTEQWSSDFLRLYPGANILAATKKDFEPANRKKFCSRIATGDYDAVIIGHSQFEKIPLSKERQVVIIERQITEIERAIEQTKANRGERYTIKQMEKTKKSLSTRLEKLNDDTRKDNVVTFEQLGVDRLFVDESHSYKNLFLYTKMRNVAGIAQTEAQKSSDMFAKCQYLDELTGGKGITFATGTPISNSMTELYTNMRYLQYGTLQKLGLGHFDSWAASFGETQTAIELAPEGTGYRAKTRFAKFFNLPELISLFKESADIQTPDMLKLPVPEAEYENVVLKPSDYQKDMVTSLADRAEAVRNRMVQPNEDNMLKITNDGRKLALDQRLINDMLPDNDCSKASSCVDKAYEIWDKTKEQKSAQLIFCDLSTPKNDGTFNVYEDIRNKLVTKGVPENEVAFIHEANTEVRKAELFAKVRSGQVRFLLGSTAKMGAGTNVQDKLIALHHMDVPYNICINSYAESYDKNSIPESLANILWWYLIIEMANKKQKLLEGVKALNQKEIKNKEFLKTYHLQDCSEDLESDMFEVDQEDDLRELDEAIIELIKELKQYIGFVPLADYYIALRYISECVSNDLTDAMNKSIGEEMMLILVRLGNEYAIKYLEAGKNNLKK